MYNLKMKEGEGTVGHIHMFCSMCEQLDATGATQTYATDYTEVDI